MRRSAPLLLALTVALAVPSVMAHEAGLVQLQHAYSAAQEQMQRFSWTPYYPKADAAPGILLATLPLAGSNSIFNKHLRTKLTIQGDNGLTYSLGAQIWRYSFQGEEDAYLSIHREGMARPSLTSMHDIFCLLFCPSRINVEPGQQFEATLHPAKPGDQSVIEIWNRRGRGKRCEDNDPNHLCFTIEQAFIATGQAALAFSLPARSFPGIIDVGVAYYQDYPLDRRTAFYSLSLLIGQPFNSVRAIPIELIPRDGRILTGMLRQRKFGLRIAADSLEIYELTVGLPLPGEVPIRTLLPFEDLQNPRGGV